MQVGNLFLISSLQMEVYVLYYISILDDAGWSSPVARRAHNPKVGGSNPSPATNVNGAFKILKASFFIHITQTGRLSEFDITHYICYNIKLIGGGAQSAHWIVNLWRFG